LKDFIKRIQGFISDVAPIEAETNRLQETQSFQTYMQVVNPLICDIFTVAKVQIDGL